MEKAGLISELELQPKFQLKCGGESILLRSKRYKNGRKASYRADFSYHDHDTGERIVEDVKGFFTPLSALKIGIVEAEYGVRVVIVR